MTKITSPTQLKSSMLEWLSAIRSRRSSYSFRFVQGRLKAAGMPSSTGWAPLIAKYEILNYSDKSTDWQSYLNTLIDIHKCSVLAGSTAVWLFDAPDDDVADILSHLSVATPEESLFSKHFPHPIPMVELMAESFSPTLVKNVSMDDGSVIVVACGKRAFREREQFDAGEIGDETRKEFGEFQELIIVRAGWTQAYDRLVFRPAKNRFEIHIDMCCPMNSDELNQLHLSYINKLEASMRKAIGRKLPWMHTAINMFPCIEKLYNANDGLVLSLGHATGTKSIKEERMRGQQLDLREELFHKHGIKAIHDTDAFSIKKGWPVSRGRHVPSVFIPGHFYKAGSTGSIVRHAIIENCATIEDFDMVLANLP